MSNGGPSSHDPRGGDWRDRWKDDAGQGPYGSAGGADDERPDRPEHAPWPDADHWPDRDPWEDEARQEHDTGPFDAREPFGPDLDGPDPVRDFFAAHRDQIVEHEADDLTWQQIRRQARAADGSRRRAWLTGAGIAASAAILGLVLMQAFRGGDEPPSPAPPPTAATDDSSITGTEEPTGDAPTPEPTEATGEETGQEPAEETTPEGAEQPPEDPATEPPSGTAPAEDPGSEDEETDAGPPQDEIPMIDAGWTNLPMGMGERLASIRKTACEDGTDGLCSTLYLSEDGGLTWGEPVDLDALGITEVDRTEDALWGWGPAGLLRSEDLGRTWTEVPHHGPQVLRVKAWPQEMVVVTGDCSGGSCTDVRITLVDPDTEDATDGPTVEVGETVSAPVLPRRTQEAVYVRFDGDAPEDAEVWRVPVDGSEGSSLRPADHCSAGPGVRTELVGAARTEDDLYLACQGTGDGEDGTVELLRSGDGGQEWEPVATVDAPRLCGLATGDGTDIVLAAVGGIWASHDSGESFTRTLEHPTLEECRISELVYASGTTYVGRARTGLGTTNPAGFFRSHDAGDSWEFVVVD